LLQTKHDGGDPLVKFTLLEKSFIIIFCGLTILAVCLAIILNMRSTALVLLLINFIVAGFVAVFGSLRLRDEEEEKLFK